MYDKEIVLELLKNIEWSIRLILKRSNEIESYEDFVKDDDGLTKLDSICMQFINIGEALKEIDKITSNELFIIYTEVDWKAVYPVKYGFNLNCLKLFMHYINCIKDNGINYYFTGRRYERYNNTSLL